MLLGNDTSMPCILMPMPSDLSDYSLFYICHLIRHYVVFSFFYGHSAPLSLSPTRIYGHAIDIMDVTKQPRSSRNQCVTIRRYRLRDRAEHIMLDGVPVMPVV